MEIVMPQKDNVDLPSRNIWRELRETKNREIQHLRISRGDDTTIVDTPMAINFRWIPKILTAPFQAIGLVTSIFARMTNTSITLEMNNEDD
jgi:hypothetical protein